jgi:glycosyltransferase involved in cell wall biosynthesis
MSRVAIITRTIDRPVLLERTLQSILAQTFTDWHWVVVDGGNSDAVPHLLHTHGERLGGRVTHLRFTNPKPGMRGVPLNAGIKACESEFITLLDDDDTWDPCYLQAMVRSMDERPHANVRGAVCRTLCIHESSVESGLKPQRSYELNPKLANLTLAQVAVVNCFCTHAFLYERSALETVGLYPEDYPVLEDWHFNLRFLLHHEIVVVPQTLTHYHFRPPETRGVQANSQTAEGDVHKFHEARLINEALREDLRTGKLGLGHILAQAALTRQISTTLHSHESRMKSIGDKTGKIDTRTKELKDKLLDKRG